MGKELPYFQFEPAHYLTGSIQFCSLQAQGLFINLLAIYWQRDCDLTLDQAKKRFGGDEFLKELITEKVVKVKGDKIFIEFLDSQYHDVVNKSKKNSIAGKKGMDKRWHKDNEIITPVIDSLYQTDNKPITIREDKRKVNKNKEDMSGRAQRFVDFVNEKLGRKYQLTPKVKSAFTQRIQNYQAPELVNVVNAVITSTHHIETGFKYCTPEFLLRQETIERYKNGPITKSSQSPEPPKKQDYSEMNDFYEVLQKPLQKVK